MLQQLHSVGNSRVLTVPAKTLRERGISDDTLFDFEDRGDGFFFRIVSPDTLTFPPVKGPIGVSEEMRSLLENPVTFDDGKRRDPIIKRLLDEDFR